MSNGVAHYLVFWYEDNHFGIYGVFNSISEIVDSINKAPPIIKVQLIHMGRIQEMEGTTVVDEIYIEEIKDSITVNMEDLSLAQENGLTSI